MFKEMRRKEKQLTIEECNTILTKSEYGALATIGSDNYPYAVPVNYIFHNGNIFFHCAKAGHKIDNINNCSNVSFSVVTDTWVVPLVAEENSDKPDGKFKGFDTNFNSVIIFGKAKEVFNEEKIEGLHAFLKKFLNTEQYNRYNEAGIKATRFL